MSTDSPRKILVVGATGKQGSSFLRAALAPDANSDLHFVALTRDTQSRAAQQVKALGERVSVVAANLDKPETLRKVFEEEKERVGFYGMFVVLAFPGLGEDGAGEERQGKVSMRTSCWFALLNCCVSFVRTWHLSSVCNTTCTRPENARMKVATNR